MVIRGEDLLTTAHDVYRTMKVCRGEAWYCVDCPREAMNILYETLGPTPLCADHLRDQ